MPEAFGLLPADMFGEQIFLNYIYYWLVEEGSSMSNTRGDNFLLVKLKDVFFYNEVVMQVHEYCIDALSWSHPLYRGVYREFIVPVFLKMPKEKNSGRMR